MVKSKRGKILIIVAIVLFVVFALLFFPVLFFPLRVDLSGHVFHVGDTMSVTATLTNKSGQDALVHSYGGIPCIHIYNIKEGDPYAHLLVYCAELWKAGDKISSSTMYEFTEPGIYIVYSHCDFSVNNFRTFNMRHNIVIVLE